MQSSSRGRRRGQGSARRAGSPHLFLVTDDDACPSCGGEHAAPEQMLRELLDDMSAVGAELANAQDPIEVELAGAGLTALGGMLGEVFDDALANWLVPQLEARSTDAAMAMLLAIGAVAQGVPGKAASAAAERLIDAGLPRPSWAADLDSPVTVGQCWRLGDESGMASILVSTFRRAGREHAAVMSVDNLTCGAASAIFLIEGDQLPELFRSLETPHGGATREHLDPAEFRLLAERALDARAVHDAESEPADLLDNDASDGPPYPVLAMLLRARLTAMPAPTRSAAVGAGIGHHGDLAALLAQTDLLVHAATDRRPRGRGTLALPAKPRRGRQPAPIFQIKVGLRSAKPPIWRRLEVPANTRLDRLHAILQAAFGWNDSHLHVFDTPYGQFGTADAELGFEAESSATLEQVAPGPSSKIRYTYDFGDDWAHDILVEKVITYDPATAYPRCTGGRRGAPPDDCGGVWGYAELTATLADPRHPEHDNVLTWLGLDNASQFEPSDFDADEVTRALSTLR